MWSQLALDDVTRSDRTGWLSLKRWFPFPRRLPGESACFPRRRSVVRVRHRPPTRVMPRVRTSLRLMALAEIPQVCSSKFPT